MPDRPRDAGAFRSLAGQLVFLGTGTSVGVPTVGCDCAVCTSPDPRNRRTRTSIALGLPGGTLLVDTTPDLRSQLLRERIGAVDAVLYTHDHVDHVYGLDDIRPLCFRAGRPMPVYCEERVERRIRRAFDYAFETVPTPDLARRRCHEIRAVNGRLACLLTGEVRSLEARSAALRTAVKAQGVLGARTHPWCFFPEKTLRSFLLLENA